MKAKITPLYFQSSHEPDFVKQLGHLRSLLSQDAEFLDPVALGAPLPKDTDAVVFPQMLGDAYKRLSQIKAITLPILVITSEFGTVSMWDWEINAYLEAEGIYVLAPNSVEQARIFIRACALKRELKTKKLLAYQDNPGEGFQADIFKRFYWWEEECIDRLESKFGIQIVKKSFRQLGAEAKGISDQEAQAAWDDWKAKIPFEGLSQEAILSVIKIYLAVKRDIDQDSSIAAAGINCLNESRFSDTTPCLAWNILYEDRQIVWGCEADLVSMMTELLVQKSLGVPFMMTNLYLFMLGMAALKHEHIPYFPKVKSYPENYILMAHCGYFGVVPQSFATQWKLKKKVLAIVDENAHAMDARLAEGDVTLLKLIPPFDQISVVEGELEFYAQFENSDIRFEYICNHDPRVNDGLMKRLPEYSIVINATGMGKDIPGSPITDEGCFPRNGIAWEFNYRGELDFMHQAERQIETRNLRVEDGWLYFVHGWTQVVAQVLHIELTDELFSRLERAAATVRVMA